MEYVCEWFVWHIHGSMQSICVVYQCGMYMLYMWWVWFLCTVCGVFVIHVWFMCMAFVDYVCGACIACAWYWMCDVCGVFMMYVVYMWVVVMWYACDISGLYVGSTCRLCSRVVCLGGMYVGYAYMVCVVSKCAVCDVPMTYMLYVCDAHVASMCGVSVEQGDCSSVVDPSSSCGRGDMSLW